MTCLADMQSLTSGAYYYHKTEPGMNYEDTMLAVHKDAIQQAIPYRLVANTHLYKQSRDFHISTKYDLADITSTMTGGTQMTMLATEAPSPGKP